MECPNAKVPELLVNLKMKEERKESEIFQVFDMTKCFDHKSLLSRFKEKAKVDNKTCHLWYMLNEDTRISVKLVLANKDLK